MMIATTRFLLWVALVLVLLVLVTMPARGQTRQPLPTGPIPPITVTPTPPLGWWNCANQCAPCPPNFKPYITYVDPYNVARYVRFDAGILSVPPGTCTPRWVGQGGPDHADLGLGADCKYYPLKTGDSTATWHYPAPPPEANLCAFYPGPEDCPTVDMATYSKRIQSNPVWIESVNTYKPQMDAECRGIAPTFTRTNTWTLTRTSGPAGPTSTPITPDECILSGRTCTPTPRQTRTLTPSFAATTPTPSATATASRFGIAVKWTKPDGTTGAGVASCSSSASSSGDASTGYWFFSSSNVELFVSVLPSYCTGHPNVMVKAMGATNVKVDITVTDRQTGKSHHFDNCSGWPGKPQDCHPQGQMFQTVIDTGSLPCQ